MAKFCRNCGYKMDDNAYVCVKCGVKASGGVNINIGNGKKSKIVAGILGIFLGAFGIHNFYLGYNNKAIGQLLLTVLSCGVLSVISGIWGLIEGVLILVGNIDCDAEGNPLSD